jgi:hypothetical protein
MSNLLARAINCDDPASDAAPAVAAWPEVGCGSHPQIIEKFGRRFNTRDE